MSTASGPRRPATASGPRRPATASGPRRPVQPIRDRATFQRLRRSGRRVRRGPVTVTWVPGEPDQPTRVAYTVGRKVGGAVVRNRVRRRLRAVVREAGELRPGAYLIGAGPEAAPMPYGELRAAACEALNALASPPPSTPPGTAAKRSG